MSRTWARELGRPRTWARELGRHGIRVTAVAPGFIATEMVCAMPDPRPARRPIAVGPTGTEGAVLEFASRDRR